jgi:hypothetical protein
MSSVSRQRGWTAGTPRRGQGLRGVRVSTSLRRYPVER